MGRKHLHKGWNDMLILTLSADWEDWGQKGGFSNKHSLMLGCTQYTGLCAGPGCNYVWGVSALRELTLYLERPHRYVKPAGWGRKNAWSNRSDVRKMTCVVKGPSPRGSPALSTSLDLHLSAPTGLVSNGHHLQFFIGELLYPQSLLCSPHTGQKDQEIKVSLGAVCQRLMWALGYLYQL